MAMEMEDDFVFVGAPGAVLGASDPDWDDFVATCLTNGNGAPAAPNVKLDFENAPCALDAGPPLAVASLITQVDDQAQRSPDRRDATPELISLSDPLSPGASTSSVSSPVRVEVVKRAPPLPPGIPPAIAATAPTVIGAAPATVPVTVVFGAGAPPTAPITTSVPPTTTATARPTASSPLPRSAPAAPPPAKRTRPAQDSVKNEKDPSSEDDLMTGLNDAERTQAAKRARRLAKNRESAHQFRQKKKAQFEQLQQQVDTLEAENTALRAENSRLHAENAQLRTTLNNAGLATPPSPGSPTPSLTGSSNASTGPPTPPQALLISTTRSRGPTTRAAGLALMVMFSVGLMFNFGPIQDGKGPSFPHESSLATVISAPPALNPAAGGALTRRGRVLQSFTENQTANLVTITSVEPVTGVTRRGADGGGAFEEGGLQERRRGDVAHGGRGETGLLERPNGSVAPQQGILLGGGEGENGVQARPDGDLARQRRPAAGGETGVHLRADGSVAPQQGVVSGGAGGETGVHLRADGSVAPQQGVVSGTSAAGGEKSLAPQQGLVPDASAAPAAASEVGLERIVGVVVDGPVSNGSGEARPALPLVAERGLVQSAWAGPEQPSVQDEQRLAVARLLSLVLGGTASGRTTERAARESIAAIARALGILSASPPGGARDLRALVRVLGVLSRPDWPVGEIAETARRLGLVRETGSPLDEVRAVARILALVSATGERYGDLAELAVQLGLVAPSLAGETGRDWEWEELKGVSRVVCLVLRSGLSLDQFAAAARTYARAAVGAVSPRRKPAGPDDAALRLLSLVAGESSPEHALLRMDGIAWHAGPPAGPGPAPAPHGPHEKAPQLPPLPVWAADEDGTERLVVADLTASEAEAIVAQIRAADAEDPERAGEAASYVFCTRAHALRPPGGGRALRPSFDGERVVSLLIPARALAHASGAGPKLRGAAGRNGTAVVEIRCPHVEASHFVFSNSTGGVPEE